MPPIWEIGSILRGCRMEQVLERIMARYGSQILWHHAGKEEALRGFLQSVTSRSWQRLLREMTPLGEVSTGLYVYLGSLSGNVQAGDVLQRDGRQYLVRRTEIIYDHQGPAYLWALCVRKGG